MSTTISRHQNVSGLREAASANATTRGLSVVDRLARSAVLRRLQSLRNGTLHVCDASGAVSVGEPADLEAAMTIHRPEFYRHALFGGTMSVAESYLRGDWDSHDLTTMFRLFVRNIGTAHRLNTGLSKISDLVNRLYHTRHANSRSGSRRNIHAHYDLGNDFFRLMLDETLAYSSGIFLTKHSSLHDASIERMDRLCRMLQLRPDDHMLEIGTGWGGLALYAAQNFGCRITTTTISRQQHDVAAQRIAAAGVGGRVTLLMNDYRDLTGQFDKIVSVEMIEAVGHEYVAGYFEKCSTLLSPGGLFALQSITMPDANYDRYLKSVDFIQRYVFPGGCLPSIQSLRDAAEGRAGLRFEQLDDFGTHYARTIREWRSRFHARLGEVRRLGYPERFVRLWDYYLSYCEAAFDEHYTGLVQVLLRKPTV